MPNAPRIRDNPSHVDLIDSMQGMAAFADLVDFFEKLGIRSESISDAIQQFPSLAEDTDRLVNLPDRFNDQFASLGWIAFESMNFEIMEQAVALSESGDRDDAEELLTAHFDEETIRFNLTRLKSFSEFEPRWSLANKALDDYVAKRFHASIPVVLLIIDGFVNDIEQTGFFAAKTDLEAWDSIAAHSSGLTRLRDIFGASRKKTTTDSIAMPYRHGILHGRDLGYDNRLVAAKSWAALFAVGDWAFAIRDGKKTPQPTPPEPSVREILEQLAQTKQMKRQLDAWSPREISADIDFPSAGVLDDYTEDTPEHTFVQVLEYWRQKNYGHMSRMFKTFEDVLVGKAAGSVRKDFTGREFKGFRIRQIRDIAAAVTEIDVIIQFCIDNCEKEVALTARLIYENERRSPVPYPNEDAVWKIMPNSFHAVVFSC